MDRRRDRHRGVLDLGPAYMRSGTKVAWSSPVPALSAFGALSGSMLTAPGGKGHGLASSMTAQHLLLSGAASKMLSEHQRFSGSRPTLRRALSAPLQARPACLHFFVMQRWPLHAELFALQVSLSPSSRGRDLLWITPAHGTRSTHC